MQLLKTVLRKIKKVKNEIRYIWIKLNKTYARNKGFAQSIRPDWLPETFFFKFENIYFFQFSWNIRPNIWANAKNGFLYQQRCSHIKILTNYILFGWKNKPYYFKDKKTQWCDIFPTHNFPHGNSRVGNIVQVR